MKLPNLQPLKHSTGKFYLVFAFPLLSTAAGLRLAPRFWLYFVLSLGSAFFLSLTVLQSLHTGRIDDSWGRLERSEHPARYWLQVGVWIALLVCSAAFPLAIALTQDKA